MPNRFRSSCPSCRSWRRVALLVVGLALALRALALPFDMAAHQAAGAPASVVATQPSAACHTPSGVAHEDTPSRQRGEEKSPGDPRVCQILCAIACAPLLFKAPLLPVHHATEARYDTPLPLPLGIVAPPDHPPPIA